MNSSRQQIIVIGAGLAGLAAARRLRAAGHSVLVLEREATPGGRARTLLLAGGFQVELGAEFLASFYTRTLELVAELGLSADLHPIPSSAAVLRNGHFHSLWPNLRIAMTRLIGVRQKLALAYILASLVRHRHELDTHAFAKARQIDDSSVSTYARAHLSEELLEYVLQPPLSGIFYWTPERTSRALLMLVLRAGLSRPTGLRLFTLTQGIGQLTAALARDLPICYQQTVQAISPLPEGGFVVQSNGQAHQAAGVVVATTASVVPTLLPWLGNERLAQFSAIRYSRTTMLAAATSHPLPSDYYGLLFPRHETPYLASATIQGVKSSSAAPHGHDLLALHMSGPAADALHQCDAAMLSRLLLTELRRVAPQYDPSATLLHQQIIHCHEALPEFDVGHFERIEQFADPHFAPPGIAFAGDYIGGPFIEGAILSGEAAAHHLLGKG
jgi:oxygen-dependent protoporphyrinogen oxidase